MFGCALDIAHIERWTDAAKVHKETSAPLLPLFLQPASMEEHTPTNHRNPYECPQREINFALRNWPSSVPL